MRILPLLFIALFLFPLEGEAARKRKRSKGPPITHPVVLWARTLSSSENKDDRVVAAFKLSQYTQTIYQEEAISALTKCIRDPDFKIKVLCSKAMGRAGNAGRADSIRKSLLEVYKEDESLRNTLVRTFTARKDGHANVREALIETVKKSTDVDELTALMKYFESYAVGNDVDAIVDLYQRVENVKIKRAAVKTVSERGQGQSNVIEVLALCAESPDTPLALTCLSGLQSQARKDSKTWSVLEKTIESGDPDVLLATLDVIHSLPEQANPKIAARLIEIANSTEDSDVLEKTLLALGVCGDHSEAIVKVLQKNLERKDVEDGIRVSAALVLGKQAADFPEGVKESLTKCSTQTGSQSLRTACKLGLQEFETRKPTGLARKDKDDRGPAAGGEKN